MVLQKLWNHTDPKDAKILALTTKLEVLESAFSTSSSDPKPPKKANGQWKPEEWLIKNVGPSIEKDGKTLYWCPHHTGPQKTWPGMYMPHKPEDHDKWQAKKDERYPKKKKAPSEATPTKLTLSDKMRSALATKMCLTPQALEEMMGDPDLN